jgi:molybdenum cofactor synthesis domain-containing protein
MPRTAAILVIGNEILSGKIRDENVGYLAPRLFALGVDLRRVIMCPDDVDVIVRDLDALRTAHDFVLTTGGIGPTHDDVTLKAVAKAMGQKIVRSPEIVRLVTKHFGDKTTEGHLRMADVPEGATLIRSGEMPWPTVSIENVYVFPGVPQILHLKFPLLEDRLRADAPFVSRMLYTKADEFELADLLDEAAAAHPKVVIGSYLAWGAPDYAVKLTFDGTDEAAVTSALDHVRAGIADGKIVHVE